MLVVIRGAGDLASGIALRLIRSGMRVVMTDLEKPLAIRRSVTFCEAIPKGQCTVEEVTARRAADPVHALQLLQEGYLPVLVDPKGLCIKALKPDAVVDAILAKRNLGTSMTDAPVVIGVGPGFCAGKDCHCVVETMRGHTLGRAIYQGEPLPNTDIPGLIGGFAGERVLRAPVSGHFKSCRQIGEQVRAGDIAGYVIPAAAGEDRNEAGDCRPGEEVPVCCTLTGVLRGLITDGIFVEKGLKIGDVDPRGDTGYCRLVSDKALAIGGGVLEAILHFSDI